MFTHSVKPFALGINGVRFYYGKRFPDHTLKFVQVFHRHGDRTPLHNYYKGSELEKQELEAWKELLPERDANNSIFGVYKHQNTKPNVPDDPVFGQLTKDGVLQMQHVGTQLRKYYMEEESLISDSSFNSTDISLRSTCRDRTLHSIESLLSTLFPVTEYKPTHPIIKINTDATCCLNKFDDSCKSECSKRLKAYDWMMYLDKMKSDHYEDVAKELSYFSDPSKIKWTDVMDFFITHYNHLMDIPESIYNMFPDVYNHNVNKFTIIYNTTRCLHSFTDDLFAMIQREASNVMKGELKTKLSVYSCHDTSVMPLLNVLTPYMDIGVPKYSANICLEYWQNDFDKSTDVAMRYNGEYQPIFIEHYQEAIIVKYEDFAKTLNIPKYLQEVMREKNKVPILEDA